MASICALCWTNDSLSVPLEYDYNALHMVCVNCGALADGELQTLGRALEGEDSHHTGRSRVESRPGLATKVEAKIGRFRSAGQVYNPSDRARKEEVGPCLLTLCARSTTLRIEVLLQASLPCKVAEERQLTAWFVCDRPRFAPKSTATVAPSTKCAYLTEPRTSSRPRWLKNSFVLGGTR
jgi:hypothetical protein